MVLVRMTTSLLNSLIMLRHPLPEWVVVFEMGRGPGFQRDPRYIDVAALNCYPSSGLKRIAYECKVSRGDFLRELRNPAKREFAEETFHETYFVVLPDVAKVEEIPENWGLLVPTKKKDRLRVVVRARQRDVPKWPGPATVALRSLAKELDELRAFRWQFKDKEVTAEQLRALAREANGAQYVAVMKARDSLRAAHFAAKDERSTIRAPLTLLRQLASGRGYFRDMADEITADHVSDWFAQMKNEATREVREHLLVACSSLDQLRVTLEVAPYSPRSGPMSESGFEGLVEKKKATKDDTVQLSGRLSKEDHAEVTELIKHFEITKADFGRIAMSDGLKKLRAMRAAEVAAEKEDQKTDPA